MGWVNQVTDAIGITDTAKSGSLLDQASNIVNDVGTTVSNAVHDIGTTIAESPILSTATAAVLIANGVPPAAAAALVTANKGGTPEQIALSAGMAGLLSNGLSSSGTSTLPSEANLPQLPVIDTAANASSSNSLYDLSSNSGSNIGIQATPGAGTNLFGNTINEGFQIPTAANLASMGGGQGLLGAAAGTAGGLIGEMGLGYNPLPLTNIITGQPLGQELSNLNTGVQDITGASTSTSPLQKTFQNQLLKKLLGSIMADNQPSLSSIGSGLLGGTGSLLQGQVSKEAAQALADRMAAATGSAVSGAQFRPVGITSRFGQSAFQVNPQTGQLESAGYTPSALANQLQQGAQSVYNLGQGYVAQSPQEAAQQWMSAQQNLLAPSRDVALSNLRNNLFQRGREGLSMAQGGDLQAANPEMAAYYNSLANQNALLASQAQQFGQQQAQFGSGLLGSGLNLMGNIENLSQNPLALSAGLGGQAATAGARAGQLGIAGTQGGQDFLYKAMTYNPLASALTGAGQSPLLSSVTGNAVNGLLGGLFSNWMNQPSTDTLWNNYLSDLNSYVPAGGDWLSY